MKECGIMNVTLSGGEAFVRKDLRELIDGLIKANVRFSILSNGTLIDDDIAKYLKSTGRCDHVQVSIDGASPESHDAFRGEGVFVQAIEGLKMLMRNGIPATVRVTLHKRNYKQLDKIAKLLLEEIGLPSFGTNAASYMGLCRENAQSVALNALEYAEVMKTFVDLEKKYGKRISAQAGPQACLKHWREAEEAKEQGLEGLPGCGFLTSCGGVFNKIAVRADGVMVPCDQISHIELGRINKDSLREVWQTHPELIRLRQRRNIPLSEFEFCKGCEYIPYCRGGCPALSYTLMGDENQPSPDACYRLFLEQGGRLPEEV